MTQPPVTVDVHLSVRGGDRTTAYPLTVVVSRDAAGEHYVGAADGKSFRLMTANRATAERELDAALRRAAAWQAILEAGLVR